MTRLNLKNRRTGTTGGLAATSAAAALLAAMTIFGAPSPASASCLTPNNTALKVALPSYAFWKPVAKAMSECGNVEVSYDFNATSVSPDSATSIKPGTHLVGISNGGLSRLNAEKAIRPLDDLVEKHKNRIHPRQLIRVDGKVMALAIAANAQVYAYHEPLFLRAQLEAPKTQADILALDRKILELKAVNDSFSVALKPGWTASNSFLELFLSTGTPLFNKENRPLIASETGEKVLEHMQKLAKISPPDPYEKENSGVLQDLMRGRSATAQLWASSTASLDKENISRVAGRMAFTPVPPLEKNGKPASAIWWDGFAISASATEEEAQAAFKTLLEGIDAEMLETAGNNAIWLMPEYKPLRLTRAVIETMDAGAPAFPATREVDILQRALGERIGDFFTGKVPAAVVLANAEADYLRVARERGLPGF